MDNEDEDECAPGSSQASEGIDTRESDIDAKDGLDWLRSVELIKSTHGHVRVQSIGVQINQNYNKMSFTVLHSRIQAKIIFFPTCAVTFSDKTQTMGWLTFIAF